MQLERCFDLCDLVDYKQDWQRLDCASMWSNLDLSAARPASHKVGSCWSAQRRKTGQYQHPSDDEEHTVD